MLSLFSQTHLKELLQIFLCARHFGYARIFRVKASRLILGQGHTNRILSGAYAWSSSEVSPLRGTLSFRYQHKILHYYDQSLAMAFP